MTVSPSLEIPWQWQVLEPERISGTVLVVGASDAGKSTLARWLVERLCRSHARVGWLDGDPGQTTLGLPTTLNLAVVDEAPILLPEPVASFFVGSTSPKGHMLQVLTGLQLLKERALAAGATALVVDTTGLVSQEAGGGALKQWKIELLRPQTVIALQRGRELEHLLGPWRLERRFAVQVLPVAEAVRQRSPEQRAARRRLLFRHYFEKAGGAVFRTGSMPIYGLEAASPGALAALLDTDGFALALGVLRGFSEPGPEVLTKFGEPSRVAALRFGFVRLDPATGDELD